MPKSSIRSNFHKPLDVEGNFLTQVAFNAMLLFNNLADFVGFVVVQFANLSIRTDTSCAQYLVRQRTADPVDVSESDFDSFVWRKIHAGNARHNFLPLSLLMLCVHANHTHDALAM